MSEALLLQGKRGSGKSLFAVMKIEQYLNGGRMVATNLNIYPDKLLPAWNRTPLHRLPDFPTAADLSALPLGNRYLEMRDGQPVMLDGYTEDANGLIVLDEAATFLNSRNWQDKSGDRLEVIKWLLQSRKFGWDLIMIAQHQRLLDAQVRDSLFELTATGRRLDKMAIPVLSRFAAWLGFRLRFPRMHIITVRYGFNPDSPVAERHFFRGTDLHQGYDTLQKIDPAVGVKAGEGYTVLSAWHLRGRYMGKWRMFRGLILGGIFFGLLLGSFGGYLFGKSSQSEAVAAISAQPQTATYSDSVHGVGYFLDGRSYMVTLSDGRTVTALAFRQSSQGWEAEIEQGLWVRGGQ